MFIISWNSAAEHAWLSIFRFIEFWMGLPYIKPNKIDSTLDEMKEDPRLPGGQIDTEYVTEESSGGACQTGKHATEENKSEEACSFNSSNDSQSRVSDGRPHWLHESNVNPKHVHPEMLLKAAVLKRIEGYEK